MAVNEIAFDDHKIAFVVKHCKGCDVLDVGCTAKAKLGESEYVRCTLCHGMAAVAGGIAPDLRASPVPLSMEEFTHVVRDGALQARGMPRFAEMSDQQLESLRHFLRQKARADLAVQSQSTSH